MALYLEISQLSEFLPTVIQEASERLVLEMGSLVGPHIAPLCESFVTDIARVGLFSRVATLVGLIFVFRVISRRSICAQAG